MICVSFSRETEYAREIDTCHFVDKDACSQHASPMLSSCSRHYFSARVSVSRSDGVFIDLHCNPNPPI
jgi:hypothetical protein